MLTYEGSIWRPPSEARSLILQATVGCSHNACIFCVSYKRKKYRVRGTSAILKDLDGLPKHYKNSVKRVFLADGNALAMPTEELLSTLNVLSENLPSLERVGIYAYAKDVRDKTVDDLKTLRDSGLGIAYYGLETGDDDLLRWVRKGVNSRENIEACKKIRKAGINLSITIILGLGGKDGSKKHAKATANVLNEINPEFIGALTLMTPPGTPIYDMVNQGEFKTINPFETLQELYWLIKDLNVTDCIFRTNHASNYLPLRGTLNRDKAALLQTLEDVLQSGDETSLRLGYMRGL